ncbi:MFS transporter [Conexibacter sp. DBS9H8]|uniref:MFS transporter n=1 Tax=Conexibacter sp. DBS9H8 TaxID=2937801 RepID=UPI00200D50EC|nr:MFS transporter [Conexibacter sp. DBS9H8]
MALRGEFVRRAGGPVRAKIILLFAFTLGLSGADGATVGAVAPQLETALHIGNTRIGLLSSVALLMGAIATIPVGMLVDRIRRMPLLAASIVLWSIASLLGAFAANYGDLLISRLLLGAVVATAGPAIASLTGDFFPAGERGRVYAYILGGELVGNALGVIVCGSVASIVGWRAAFVLLALPGIFLAWALWRGVPEPKRGGQSHLYPGAEAFEDGGLHPTVVFDRPPVRVASPVGSSAGSVGGAADTAHGPPPLGAAEVGDDRAREAVRAAGVEPEPERILHQDPRGMRIADVVRYAIAVPTNVLMIVSSSLGYFFFGGLTTFAILFIRGRYHAGQVEAELVLVFLVVGALIGTLVGGRVTDLLLDRGHLQGRVWVPAVCYLLAVVLLVPGFLGTSLTPAIYFDTAGAALITAANPALNAARLDIMPAGLWGRAESIRTVVRSLAEAVAPVTFGALADLVAGVIPQQTPVGTHTHVAPLSSSAAQGLEWSFIIMLATVALAGVFLLRARATYAIDVATAAASNQGTD